ncbi:engulfment and cell motility protein 1-like [Xenia sp. Carnegie-2017]|uniref:engulfment and cell motility protein 1-like n=1 Tax=Xenia sp. Carnegie-2017 TaxID=2897299 RepID=UPI001F046325|nr:engulfment and cell motility protein 1-like [Xenia sp. Carnegie-2017]
MPDLNIVKLAVKPPEKYPHLMSSLLHFNQTYQLQDIINELCEGWNIPDPDQLALQYENTNTYINEQNRNELTNGAVLVLVTSPAKLAKTLYDDVKSADSELQKHALARLAAVSEDSSFALEFIKLEGLTILLQMIDTGIDSSELRAHVLTSFQELMEHNIVSWNFIYNAFVKKLCSFVNTTALTDPTVLKRSLSILESIVQNSPNFYAIVSADATIESLKQHLQNVNEDVRINTISLINALIMKTPSTLRDELSNEIRSIGVRNVLLTNMIRNSRGVSDDMAHQLYTYQQLTLNFLQHRMNMVMREDDQREKEKIETLRKTVFDYSASHSDVQMRISNDYKKLGFEHCQRLSENFRETPPGLLALDCMMFFCKNYPDSYEKVVKGNLGRGDGHECPFAKSSIALVKLLCGLLNVGEQPDETSNAFYPIFFSTDAPFQELFCICIMLLGKTWREMKAKQEDFTRVMTVVEKQINVTLKEKHPTFENFKTYINGLKVETIIGSMIQGSGTNINVQSKPIAHLRKKILPDLLELMKDQRFNFLIAGTRFEKPGKRKTNKESKYWYCRLSQNRRFLHYGNCDETSKPNADQLQNKVAIAEIDDLLTGTDCPHTQEANRQKKTQVQWAFSLTIKEKSPLNFIAPDQDTFDNWVDGLSILLEKKLRSKTWEADLDKLVSMELKLRLLDLENIKIPEEAPPIPPDPSNYEFRYNFN